MDSTSRKIVWTFFFNLMHFGTINCYFSERIVYFFIVIQILYYPISQYFPVTEKCRLGYTIKPNQTILVLRRFHLISCGILWLNCKIFLSLPYISMTKKYVANTYTVFEYFIRDDLEFSIRYCTLILE